MDFHKALDEIASWNGAEKEYWVGVNILKRYNQISELELQRLNNGCDCWNEEYLVKKLLALKELALSETSKVISLIEIEPEVIAEAVTEVIEPSVKIGRKRNGQE